MPGRSGSRRARPPSPLPSPREVLARHERAFRERGVTVTRQRMAILKVVLETEGHLTADEVHALLARRMPRVSRTTVYRALESLVEQGAITKACHPGVGVRYDKRTGVHHHLVCLRCDAIVDVDAPALDVLPLPDTSAFGFEITDHRVQLRGFCRRCRTREEKRR
jgi:Fe2+ or Zn2+ uptake regulation protein